MCNIALDKKVRSETTQRGFKKPKTETTPQLTDVGFPACALDYPCSGPSLPGKRGQRGKPQDCRIITSACLSFPLESQFQPLQHRRRKRRRGGLRRQQGWRGRGVIRHYCLSLPTPAGQNDLASPGVALKRQEGQRGWE